MDNALERPLQDNGTPFAFINVQSPLYVVDAAEERQRMLQAIVRGVHNGIQIPIRGRISSFHSILTIHIHSVVNIPSQPKAKIHTTLRTTLKPNMSYHTSEIHATISTTLKTSMSYQTGGIHTTTSTTLKTNMSYRTSGIQNTTGTALKTHMPYQTRALSDASHYGSSDIPAGERSQRYVEADYSTSNRYRDHYPRDIPRILTCHESDRSYISRSNHGDNDSYNDSRDYPSRNDRKEPQARDEYYIVRRYYYPASNNDEQYQSAQSGTSNSTRGTKTRNERDVEALPSSLQTLAREVDAEFSRLERVAESLERKKARREYDVNQYEEVKRSIAHEWNNNLRRHDEICQEKTRIERSHSSVSRSSQSAHTSGNRSSHGRTHVSQYDNSDSDAESVHTIRPSDDYRTFQEFLNYGHQVPEDSKTTTKRRQASAKDERTHQSYAHNDKSKTKTEPTRQSSTHDNKSRANTERTRQSSTHDDRSRVDAERKRQSSTYDDKSRAKSERGHSGKPSEKTRPFEKPDHNRDEKSKSKKDWRQSAKDKPRRESKLPDIIEEVNIPNHYGTLGISSQASAAEIKRAVREKRFQTHPDKVKKSGMSSRELQEIDERAARVGQAADVLTDPEQKNAYDRAWNSRR